MINDSQCTRRVRGGRTVGPVGFESDLPRTLLANALMRIGGPDGIRTGRQQARHAECAGTMQFGREPLRQAAPATSGDGERAGCAVRTEPLPLAAEPPARGHRRAASALGRRWRLDAREAHHRFATVDRTMFISSSVGAGFHVSAVVLAIVALSPAPLALPSGIAVAVSLRERSGRRSPPRCLARAVRCGSPDCLQAVSLSCRHCQGPIASPVATVRTCGDRSVVKDDTQQRAVHFQPAVVFDQPEFAELVHEEVHP